jgi:hypothetical protein
VLSTTESAEELISSFATRREYQGRNEASGAPGEIRTPDPLLRRQTLYPTELRALRASLPYSLLTVEPSTRKASCFTWRVMVEFAERHRDIIFE